MFRYACAGQRFDPPERRKEKLEYCPVLFFGPSAEGSLTCLKEATKIEIKLASKHEVKPGAGDFAVVPSARLPITRRASKRPRDGIVGRWPVYGETQPPFIHVSLPGVFIHVNQRHHLFNWLCFPRIKYDKSQDNISQCSSSRVQREIRTPNPDTCAKSLPSVARLGVGQRGKGTAKKLCTSEKTMRTTSTHARTRTCSPFPLGLSLEPSDNC
ncbi:hypothetical protein LZ31DRAFT_19428 [Colletotrichum somersetense]|nr:hypothetical protein LZ31DRAFT_19428 [Colletotrichum somersetense]